MSKFEDHLWTEFVREHGDAVARLSGPTVRHPHRGPRLIAGTGVGRGRGRRGGGARARGDEHHAGVRGDPQPRRHGHDLDRTVAVASLARTRGCDQLGIRAQVMPQVPVGCHGTLTVAQQGQGAPASGQYRYIAKAQWTIDPRKVPRDQRLALTPPPTPPGGNSGNSGNSVSGATSGSRGDVWSCGTEGPGGAGARPRRHPRATGGNSGNS